MPHTPTLGQIKAGTLNVVDDTTFSEVADLARLVGHLADHLAAPAPAPTHAPVLDDSLARLDKLIAANSPTDGSKRELAWHHLATIVREIGRQVAANATEPADSHPLPATVEHSKGPLGVGQMIRHAAAVSRLHIGAIVYNTTEVRDILGAENRHYFRHIARGHWMPCTSAGVVHVLPDFPDGFTSGQLFLPVHVYAA